MWRNIVPLLNLGDVKVETRDGPKGWETLVVLPHRVLLKETHGKVTQENALRKHQEIVTIVKLLATLQISAGFIGLIVHELLKAADRVPVLEQTT